MFPISLIAGEPVWDSLPVAKITNYPLEPADYKPFAQARLCISQEDVYLRMLAFEVEPSPHSFLGASLSFFPESDGGRRYFWISSTRAGELQCAFLDERVGSRTDFSRRVASRVFAGEDLQGIYWCVSFRLPLAVVEEAYSGGDLRAGQILRGNFYKVSDDPVKPHYGSFTPCDFTAPDPYAASGFGEFELVRY